MLRIGVIEPAKFAIQQGIFRSVLFADEDCEGCEPAAGTSVGASNEEFPEDDDVLLAAATEEKSEEAKNRHVH